MKNGLQILILCGLSTALAWASPAGAAPNRVIPGDERGGANPVGEKVFYRYVNAEGVKVLRDALPPEAAQKGYEIVGINGVVLKVVPPALSGDAAAQMAEQKARQLAQEESDAALLRRYSTVEDIEAAKLRKLSDLEASMSILTSNMNTVQNQIRQEYTRGAGYERRGQPVPNTVHQNLDNFQRELEETKEKFIQREWEYEEVAEKFEQDKVRFNEIRNQ